MPSPANNEDKSRSRQGRIPATLQAVFLASNRGKNVDKPPPAKVASKVFIRNWLFQRQTATKENDKSLLDGLGSRRLERGHTKSVIASTPKKKKKVAVPTRRPAVFPTVSPQVYLDAMIRSQGYSTRRFKSLQSTYYSKPSQLQTASYHMHLIEVVKSSDHTKLAAMIGAGLSPNPCNTYGESLVHMVSRLGDAKALQIFINHGAQVLVVDDFGRTPLHDCCGSATNNPAFDVADIILSIDPRVCFMTDSRGATPLAYVCEDHWVAWIEYLEDNKNRFCSKRKVKTLGEGLSELFLDGPNCRPLVGPPGALTLELAKMVSSGKMEPEEAQFIKYDKLADEDTVETREYDISDEDDSESDSDYDSEDEYS